MPKRASCSRVSLGTCMCVHDGNRIVATTCAWIASVRHGLGRTAHSTERYITKQYLAEVCIVDAALNIWIQAGVSFWALKNCNEATATFEVTLPISGLTITRAFTFDQCKVN